MIKYCLCCLLLSFLMSCTCSVGGYNLEFFPKYDYAQKEKELNNSHSINQENRYNDFMPHSKWVLPIFVTWEKKK